MAEKILWELRVIIDPLTGETTNTKSDRILVIDLTCEEASHRSSGDLSSRIPLVDLTGASDCVKASCTSTFSGIPLIDLTCSDCDKASCTSTYSGIPLIDLTETDCVNASLASSSKASSTNKASTSNISEGSARCLTGTQPWILQEWEPQVRDSPMSPAYTRDRGLQHNLWMALYTNSAPSSPAFWRDRGVDTDNTSDNSSTSDTSGINVD